MGWVVTENGDSLYIYIWTTWLLYFSVHFLLEKKFWIPRKSEETRILFCCHFVAFKVHAVTNG